MTLVAPVAFVAKGPAARDMREVRTPNKPGSTARVDAVKYEAMRRHLLGVLPAKPPGLTQAEYFEKLRHKVDPQQFPGSTYRWWGKSVQLDLEARGLVKRDPSAKPIRWWRAK